jgi:hypothetical protein
LLSMLCVSAETIVLEDLIKPSQMEVNDDFLYFKDGWNIKIYSINDFKPVKTIGHKGEGPGEFNGYFVYCLTPDHIFCDTSGRAVYFTTRGDYVKQKVTSAFFARFKPLGDKHFLGYQFLMEDGQRKEIINLYNSDFKPVKELYRRNHFIDKEGNMNLIDERPPYFRIYNDKAYLDSTEGEILVFDKTGELVSTLKPNIKRVPFTAAHKQKSIEKWTKSKNPKTRRFYEDMKNRLLYPKFFPAIRMFHVTDEKIYILTYTEKNNKNEIIIIDLTGKELKRVFFPISPILNGAFVLNYGIRKDKLYLLRENQDTDEWEIYIHNLQEVI